MALEPQVVVALILLLVILCIILFSGERCKHLNKRRWKSEAKRRRQEFVLCGETCKDCGAERVWAERV